MENRRISIYKQIICNGSKVQCDSNDLLKNKVEDLRYRLYNQKIKNVGYNPFLLLTLYEDGLFVTVMKFLEGGRDNDYVAEWIFVPNKLEIPRGELKGIVDRVKDRLLDKSDDSEIQELIKKQYETREINPSRQPSKGFDDAVRYYGYRCQYSLEEILNDPFQDEYAKYRSVILLDSSTNMKYDEAEDLTKQPIKKSAILSFPNSYETTHGFTPYIDGEEKQWYPCYVENSIPVVWKKDGYADIQKLEYIRLSEQTATPPLESEMTKIIPLNKIYVYDNEDNSNEIKNFTVKYKEKEYPQNKPIEVLESDYKSAEIIIKADGYKAKSILIEKACLGKVYLDPKPVKYPISLYDENGNYINNFEIHTKGNTLKQKLREGTHLAIKNNLDELHNNNWRICDKDLNEKRSRKEKQSVKTEKSRTRFSKKLLISLLLGLILGFVIGQMIPRSSSEPQPDSDTAVAGTDSANTLTRQDSIKMMVSYLDDKDEWKKDSFECYGFKDLYKAMVHYKFDKIRSKEASLSESHQFEKLLKVIPTTEEDKNKFSGKSYENDPSEINVDSYIEKIKEIIEQPKPAKKPASDQSKGTTPSSKKKGSKVESKVPKKSTSSNPTTKSGMTDVGR